jgi:hypothetical protein
MLKTVHQIISTDEYIAEAQRLAIAQNKTLKFFYQTWWSWWVPRVMMVGLIIFCVVIHLDWSITAWLVGFLVLSFFGEWFGQRSLAKARKRTQFRGTTTTISMDENGVDMVGPVGNSQVHWAGILRNVAQPNGVLIQFSRLAWIWLPDSALTEGTAPDVRKLLAENVKDAGNA